MPQISPARKAAYSILLKVESGEAHSDDLLRRHSVSVLSQQDRNLTTALVLGVLRQQIALDRQIRAHLNKPNARLDAEVLIALRLGAFQILHMDRIPARAAIDESVELTKRAGYRFASGMVNAVLRKLAISAPRQGTTSGAPEEPLNLDGASNAYPEWLVTRWKQFFGDDAACEICRHGQMQHSLSIRVDDPAVEAELADAGVELAPGALLADARIIARGDVTATEAFRAGRVRVQDEGSQLVAEIAGRANAILDCCAAREARRSFWVSVTRMPASWPARQASRVSKPCNSALRRLARASNVALPMRRLSPSKANSTSCSPTCLAAERAPSAATPKSATA